MTGKSKPNILIIPTPKRTLEEWDKTVPGTIRHFTELGLPTDILHELYTYDRRAMEDRVAKADLVYTTGGDTLHMMDTLADYGIPELLGARALKGDVVLTASAGSILPTTWGQSDSMSYRPETGDTWDYVRVD